jgi:fructose-1,6-bisphosphatase
MMVLNKSETIKELEAAYVKFAKQSKEFYALESELRSKIQNASSSEEAALLREALSKEIRYILDQLIYLKYCSPNLKYFDLLLDGKVI